MSLNLNLKNLPLADLQAIQSAVADELKKVQTSRAAELRRRVEAIVKSEGFALKDLFPIARRRNPRDIRAVNPHNPTQTWSGRGRRPQWLTPEILERSKPHHTAGQG